MKILVAVDQNPYSTRAVEEVSRLAANTWANVSLLGVQPKDAVKGKTSGSRTGLTAGDGPVPEALFSLRRSFLSCFDREECPYIQTGSDELVEIKKGIYEVPATPAGARKQLNIRLRLGSPGKEILNEAREEESDLIVLGCDQNSGCGWESGNGVPRKVANDAPCSVLIVKKGKKNIKRIMCCLDHDRVSQPSLEMINQMVTLHGAQLTIVGLAESLSLKAEVEKKMDKILRYYHARKIDPWVELVELASLESFVARESRWGLMALWMGKQSILEKALPRSKFNKLLKGGEASVLILR